MIGDDGSEIGEIIGEVGTEDLGALLEANGDIGSAARSG